MKRILNIFLVISLLFSVLCGCNSTDTASNNSSIPAIATQTANTNIFKQFLDGKIRAVDNDGTLKYIDEYAIYGKLPQDYRYTFFDVNFVGEKELCVGEYKYILCFKIIDNNVMYYQSLIDTKLLNNGAVLYEHHQYANEAIQYTYKSPENSELNFEWNSEYTLYGVNYPEEYFINGVLVSKEEYEKRTEAILSIVDDEVIWYDRYNNVVSNATYDYSIMLSVVRCEKTMIDENGNEIYFKDYNVKGYNNETIKIKTEKYTFNDIDRDGTRELVVLVNSDLGLFLILDKDGDNVYCHSVLQREFINLKLDGTFIQSSGATNNQIALLELDKTQINFIVLAQKIDVDKVYTINGKYVSKEKVDAFFDEFNNKESVLWIDGNA